MHDLSLYEKKIISDEEFPVQLFTNHIRKIGDYCPPHWHEHLELHYVLEGDGTFLCNHKPLKVRKGSLVIVNSNELHEASTQSKVFDALVMIFEMDAFSREVADFNVIFQSLIAGDEEIGKTLSLIYQEYLEKDFGYKLIMKGKIYELITYLLRNYVVETLSDKESFKRKNNLDRFNMVLQYIESNYTDDIDISSLAKLVHLSEYRFCHLFKESIGISPLNYINEVRLKKAHHLLEQKELTVSEVSLVVGFQDYNNFGRLFKKYYGYTPSSIWK